MGQKSYSSWIPLFILCCKKSEFIKEIILTVPDEGQLEQLSIFLGQGKNKMNGFFPRFGRGW
jgi:hypothetical protein